MKTLRTKITFIVSVILIGMMGLSTICTMMNSNHAFVRPIQEATPVTPNAQTYAGNPTNASVAPSDGETIVLMWLKPRCILVYCRFLSCLELP